MTTRTSECLIALGNLRASAYACVGLLARTQNAKLERPGDQLSRALETSGPIEVLDANIDETGRELAALVAVASELADACRGTPFDEDAMRVIRSFEGSIAVARAVLRSSAISGVHRATAAPQDPTRKTG